MKVQLEEGLKFIEKENNVLQKNKLLFIGLQNNLLKDRAKLNGLNPEVVYNIK